MADPVSRYRVLIVDDQRDVRHMLRCGIETMGYDINVIDVPSGEEAILVTSRQPIDLLVSDVRLAGISGLELQERAHIRNPNMKFILITGLADTRTRREVANAGADAFFFKPVELSEFLFAVQSCLGLTKTTPAEIVVAEAEAYVQSLSECLANLRHEIKAVSVILLDDSGQVMEQAGELPAQVGKSALISSLVANISAALKVEHLMGIAPPRDLMFFAGQSYDLSLTHVGDVLVLLIVTQNSAWDDEKTWRLVKPMRLAVHNMLTILGRMGVSTEMHEKVRVASEPVKIEQEPPINEEILPELEAILGEAKLEKLKTKDVDAFWDLLTEGGAGEVTRADVISYEQARQLGLAPGEQKNNIAR